MTGKILIATDMSEQRIVLTSRLSAAHYTVSLARDVRELMQLAYRMKPDVLILSDSFDGADGLNLMRRVRSKPGLAALPSILMTRDTAQTKRIDCIQAGADAVLTGVPEAALLRARLRNLMRRSAIEAELVKSHPASFDGAFAEAVADFSYRPGQIALIGANLAEGLEWRNGLTAQMRDRIAVLDPANALRDLDALPAPDAIVLGDGLARTGDLLPLISDLRSRPETLNAAIVLTLDDPNPDLAQAALDMGLSDVLEAGFDATEVAHILRREIARKTRNDTRRAELKDGLRLANTDPLTGAQNRRSALQQLDRVMQDSEASGRNFAVLVLDLDRFKAVNDTHGHAAGDTVLVELTKRMSTMLRRGDFLARIGGEEFLAVIRNCERPSATIAAERLRQSVAAAPVRLAQSGTEIDMTVSIGMVIGGPGGVSGSAAELIDLADQSLYEAKADGRNQVNVYESAA